MIMGDRLRVLREQKGFDQGEIEKRTGLLRCYISRVEHGHTVPAVETLVKFAGALEVPMYQLFYDGGEPPKQLKLAMHEPADKLAWGSSGRDARWFGEFSRVLARVGKRDRKLLMFAIKKMAK